MPDATPEQKTLSRLDRWILASRPKTLTAAAAPVLVGWAIAYTHDMFFVGAAIATMLVAFAIQIGTNLHNDVSDFQRGTDRADRLGPTRVTQAGYLSPQDVRRGAILCFTVAGIAGSYLVLRGGVLVLLIGGASILAALAYSAGPSPLSENGLADVFVMIFFGFVALCGTVYVLMGRVPPEAWLSAGAVGSTITALLVVNNVRDIDSDRLSGRRTIPVVFGRSAGIAEYNLLLVGAYLSPLMMVVLGIASVAALLPLFTFPLAVRWSRFLAKHEGQVLNRCLGGTAQLIFLHGYALAFGIALPALLQL